MAYTVDVEVLSSGVMLAVEDLEHLRSVTINRTPLALTSCGHWIDVYYDKLAVPDTVWQTGHNEIVLTMDYYPTSGVEASFLLGDFGVILRGDKPALTLLPETLGVVDIVPQGLPFYSGRVDYRPDVPIAGDALITMGVFWRRADQTAGQRGKTCRVPAIPGCRTRPAHY